MNEIDYNKFPGVFFGEGARILSDDCKILEGTRIEEGVTIEAGKIRIGNDCVIQKNTVIKGIRGYMNTLSLGDNVFIGFSNQILVPEFSMNDFSQLHNSGLHNGYKPLTIGYNCWIGQQSILNSTEKLTIGNNVRIGTHSQLWTHVASGELLDGCTLFGEYPLELKDNVWIVGGAVISPGLVLERNAIIMTGSVLTKSAQPFHTYAGVPAKDITDKLSCWKEVTISEKKSMMEKFVKEFLDVNPAYIGKVHFEDGGIGSELDNSKAAILISCNEDFKDPGGRITLFNIYTKTYTKKRSAIEIDFIRFNLGFRARFIPHGTHNANT